MRLDSMLGNTDDVQIDIPRKNLNIRRGDKWSIMEQVSHLCNSEEVWYGRIDDFLSGSETFLSRSLKADVVSEDIKVLLRNFFDARSKLIARVEQMDEATASLTIFHKRLQKHFRLVDSLFTTAEHDDHHLAKIRGLLI